nr:hypothetical protein CTI12_AA305860 [Tanacetum cinerariifolium]GEV25440.1 hypothetical protein CTI12_AA305860 [Tanacetum cinerariifolium]
MYLLHVNMRNAQDELRNSQDELVQVNAKRDRVAFFNKMMMLLVSSMFLIRFMQELMQEQLVHEESVKHEQLVKASKAKRAAKNHDLLALIAHSNIYSSQSYASPSYSNSPQPYYVTHPSSVVDYEEDYQRELKGMLRKTSSQLVDIQTKNDECGGNGENVQRYNCNARGHYACDFPKPKVHDAKYFKEQMLLAMKDEAGGTLNDEENDFMLDNAYGDETLEELTTTVIMMTRIQPADDNAETKPKYDAEAVS